MIDWDTELITSAEAGDLNRVKVVLDNKANVRALNHYAIRLASKNGHLEIVKYLVTQGADITASDNDAIGLASAEGYSKIVEFLIQEYKRREQQNSLKLV